MTNILNNLIESVEAQNLHVLSIVVRKDGQVIAEHHFQEPKPTLLWSVSKNFTSMAIGIAEAEGYLSVEDLVLEYFPEMKEDAKPFLRQLKIHHLLSMTTGHENCPMEKEIRVNGPFDDITGLFFSQPLVYEPGTHFTYNNAASYILSKIISITTGLNLNTFLQTRLYEPLGIEQPKWEADVHNISFGCNGLYLTAMDVSKVGQLLLNQGLWNGRQLIPKSYIEKATTPQVATSTFDTYFATSDHKQGYGYQIWMNSVPNSYRMDGLFGQYVVILPDQNAVVTYISNERVNMTGILELTWKTLLNQL